MQAGTRRLPLNFILAAGLGAACLVAAHRDGFAENPDRDRNQPNTQTTKEQRQQCEKLGENSQAYRNCIDAYKQQSRNCEGKAGQQQANQDCRGKSNNGGGWLGSIFPSIFN